MPSRPSLDPPADPAPDQPVDNVLVRDTEFWFEGGSIVLVAGEVAFKVYRETLAVPSVVFQGMFQFPPNVAVLTLDGCPVVRVTDSPQDFRHLLRVLFPQPAPANAKIHFSHVSAYIRLAHKYKMNTIRDNGIRLLMDYYDARYHAWMNRDEGPLEVLDIHAIDAIHIAHLTGTDIILPLAFLQCAILGSKLVWGFGREDGTRIYLAPRDLARALRIRDQFRETDDDAISELGPLLATCGTADECTSPNRCRIAACVAWPTAVSGQDGGDAVILRPWQEVVNTVFGAMCGRCREGLLRQDPLRTARDQLWAMLPELLDIRVPGWAAASRRTSGYRRGLGTILTRTAY